MNSIDSMVLPWLSLKNIVTVGYKKVHLDNTSTRVPPSGVYQSRQVSSPDNHGNNEIHSDSSDLDDLTV